MSWRFYGSMACTVAMAVSCGSDVDQTVVPAEAAGAAGDAGTPSNPSGGMSSGAAGMGGEVSALAGAAGTPVDVVGGAGGAPSMAEGGLGGGDSESPPPASACGDGKYDAGEPGCLACPSLPAPNVQVELDCERFAAAERDGDGNLRLSFDPLAVHEPLGGDVAISWADETQLPGEAIVQWSYSIESGSFVFQLPLEARYAAEFTLASWPFADACGFRFGASNLRVYRDGVESWQCGQP